MKKAVVFDLDGTLLDTLADLTHAVNHFLRSHSFPERSDAEVRSFLGSGAKYLIKCSLPYECDGETLEKYLREYVEYYNAHSNIETKPYDGVLELLRSLREKGIATAIVSNKPDAAVKELSREYFGDLIDFAVGDRADISRKPSPDPVHLALRTLGCSDAVFVGDSEIDVQTAKNAEIPCVCVTWGFRDKDQLIENGAEIFASSSEELKNAIFKSLGLE